MSSPPTGAVTENLLMENAVAAALSAIEIYNKPDFKYRESTFTILMVNAWELLLKAKILKDSGDFDSLLVVDKAGNPKTTRSGNPMTHEVTYCVGKLGLPTAMAENIMRLIELRDTVIHLCPAEPVQYLVYTLAAASVRNFHRACDDWFGRSLNEYHFYILPLSFAATFSPFSPLELSKQPDLVRSLITSMATSRESVRDEGGYQFVCEIRAEVVSAKKLTTPADITVAINPDAEVAAFIRDRSVTDRYPLAYEDLWRRVKEELPQVRQNELNRAIKATKLKEDKKYSHPNFLQPKHFRTFERTGQIKKGTTFLYNEEAFKMLVEVLRQRMVSIQEWAKGDGGDEL